MDEENLIGRRDYRMPPRKVAVIEELATQFLGLLAPEVLQGAPLDVLDLVDRRLQREEIDVQSATSLTLCEEWGGTSTAGRTGDRKLILLREELFDALEDGGSNLHLARGTVVHEVGHAAMHVDFFRRRRAAGASGLLQREATIAMRTIEGSEWQAWCFGTFLIAPRASVIERLAMPGGQNLASLAEYYGVSVSLMSNHLRRMNLRVSR